MHLRESPLSSIMTQILQPWFSYSHEKAMSSMLPKEILQSNLTVWGVTKRNAILQYQSTLMASN